MVGAVLSGIAILVILFVDRASGAELSHYRNPQLPETFPFSSAVVVGETIYLSGELGLDYDTMTLVDGGVAAETTQIFENYQKTLAALGAGLSDIVKCTVFLDDMAEYSAMNEAYAAALPDPKPARSTFGVDGLALGAALEIECIAVRKSHAED
ncbi:MAG: RidA family protein [Marinicaulis sp.]|nr:RidA family protein [Marinicaulis sp.]